MLNFAHSLTIGRVLGEGEGPRAAHRAALIRVPAGRVIRLLSCPACLRRRVRVPDCGVRQGGCLLVLSGGGRVGRVGAGRERRMRPVRPSRGVSTAPLSMPGVASGTLLSFVPRPRQGSPQPAPPKGRAHRSRAAQEINRRRHAAVRPGATSRLAGVSAEQRASASGQRVRNRRPEGGGRGVGGEQAGVAEGAAGFGYGGKRGGAAGGRHHRPAARPVRLRRSRLHRLQRHHRQPHPRHHHPAAAPRGRRGAVGGRAGRAGSGCTQTESIRPSPPATAPSWSGPRTRPSPPPGAPHRTRNGRAAWSSSEVSPANTPRNTLTSAPPTVIDEAPGPDRCPRPLRQRTPYRHRSRTAQRDVPRGEDVDLRHMPTMARYPAAKFGGIPLDVAHRAPLSPKDYFMLNNCFRWQADVLPVRRTKERARAGSGP
ncbi:hypothetical protein GA0115254_120065 [Streptomyces sp. Ncost-T10-10d]|nr:hypothetical protein GA0115254_120065 [Streptomyces sp. Ncost-T10-10d]